MKKVFSSNWDCAHAWANQSSQTHGKTNSMFFEHGTIYSYGHHFPIATKFKLNGRELCLITTRNYSVTTAKHIGIVRGANKDVPIFAHNAKLHLNEWGEILPEFIEHNNGNVISTHRENLARFVIDLGAAWNKLIKARKKEIHIGIVNGILGAMLTYCDTFGITDISECGKYEPVLIPYKSIAQIESAFNTNRPDLSEYLAVHNKRIADELRERQKTAKNQFLADFKEWQNFESETVWIPDFMGYNAVLRFKSPDEIQTNKGIKINKLEAIQLYREIDNILSGRKIFEHGLRIQYYRVNSIDAKHIKIGCHTFRTKDITDFYNVYLA